MKKKQHVILGGFLVLSLILSSCTSLNGNNKSNPKETLESKSVEKSEAESKGALANTYWKVDLKETEYAGARTFEFFFFDDGTFHSREYRTSYYGYTPFYVHYTADEYLWRLDGEHLEIEFLTHKPDRRIIFNATYDGNTITMDDYLEGNEDRLTLTKEDSIPKLSNLKDDSEKLKGEWVEVIHEDSVSSIVVEDYYTPSTLQIVGDNNALSASYTFNKETALGTPLADESFIDATVVLKDEPASDSALNEFWHAQLTDATDASRDNSPTLRQLILVNDDMLILEQQWKNYFHETEPLSSENMDIDEATEQNSSDENVNMEDPENGENASAIQDEYSNDTYDTLEADRHSTQIFLRKGSKAYENRDELRYRNTVTVSNVQELSKSIANNTRIILKEGIYNLSELETDEYDNPSDYLGISSQNNVCIEAEKGKKVELVTNDPYIPVISLSYSDNIKLKGLTVGHNVEKGECSGSVIRSNYSKHITIEDCHLYGCGTYGIEAESTQNMIIHNTEIYECTYGLLHLYDCHNIAVKNSTLRDSEESSMFDVHHSSDILIENSKITGNTTNASYSEGKMFILNAQSTNFVFRNCDFSDNKYETLSYGDVSFENCNFNDNVQ